MNRYIAAVLLLQCFAETFQSNSTNQLTWREILPDYCGLRFQRLLEKLKELEMESRAANEDGRKIVGGELTTIEDHPWQVAILSDETKAFMCGGSIISKYHVLTAAHCFTMVTSESINGILYKSTSTMPYRKRVVAVGSSRYAESDLVYKIKELYIHNFFSYSHHRNDIALLKIDGKFVWSKMVWPICLPVEDEQYQPGRECHISGFGDKGTENPNLRGWLMSGIVNIKSESSCKYKIEQKLGINITEGMICAGGDAGKGGYVDSCEGDSGGPLNCQHINNTKQVLLGITSFGYKCGLRDYPGVYTQVVKHLQWIRSRVDVSLSHGGMDRLPEDNDVGRPAFYASKV